MGVFQYRFVVGCLGVFVWAGAIAVFAAETPNNVGSSSALPTQSGFLPTQSGGPSANFQGCFDINPALSQLGDILKGNKPSGGAGGACGGSETAPDAGTMDCKVYSESWKTRQLEKLDSVESTLSCKQGQLEGMKGQLGCLSQQSDILSSQIKMLEDAYTKNIQRMQQDVAKMKAMEANRKAQQDDVLQKLQGGKDSGAKGLLKLREETQAMVAKMPAEVDAIKERHRQSEVQRKALEEQVQIRTMALTNECFVTQRKGEYRCVPNGPPVTAREYVLCRYQQNQYVGEGGIIEKGATINAKAASRAQGLASLLDQILGDSPTNSKLPSSEQETAANMGQPLNVLNPAELESRFGKQLASYNGKGLDVKAFIVKTVSNCYSKHKSQVDRERARANTQLGVAAYKLKQFERETNTQVNTILNTYSQQYSEVMAGLTGQHLPLTLSACQTSKPEVQANCLQDVRRNMEGLLAGNLPQSTMDIAIRGNDPQTNIQFRCQGLNGCITTMQNVNRNLQLEVQRVVQFKKDYVMRANQSIQSYTKQMAGLLSIQSQALSNRLKSINSTLATLGVKGKIDIKPVEGEELEADEANDGLYKTPKSVINLVGSQMSPKMLDVESDNFSDALGGVSERVSEIGEKREKLEEARARIAKLEKECSADKLNKLAANVAKDITNLVDNGNCATLKDWCDASKQSELANLISSISSIDSESGISDSDLDGLQNGINGVCPNSVTPGENNKAPLCATAYSSLKKDVQALVRKASPSGADAAE